MYSEENKETFKAALQQRLKVRGNFAGSAYRMTFKKKIVFFFFFFSKFVFARIYGFARATLEVKKTLRNETFS